MKDGNGKEGVQRRTACFPYVLFVFGMAIKLGDTFLHVYNISENSSVKI
jgi:hypothetical protein